MVWLMSWTFIVLGFLVAIIFGNITNIKKYAGEEDKFSISDLPGDAQCAGMIPMIFLVGIIGSVLIYFYGLTPDSYKSLFLFCLGMTFIIISDVLLYIGIKMFRARLDTFAYFPPLFLIFVLMGFGTLADSGLVF